jgi:hypothetical protein
MPQTFDSLQPGFVPEGFRLFGKEQGIYVGEFWGSREQIALHYRKPRQMWGLGSEITICWAPEKNLMLTGTTNRVGVPVTVNGMPGVYHDGMWMPGPGPEEVKFEPNGTAHWGRDLVHSITMHTSEGVFGLRAPRTSVPHLESLVQIMSTMSTIKAPG